MPKNERGKRRGKSTAKTTTYLPNGRKDYSYRSTWEHKFSRARNKARRGGLSKPEMMKRHGRFPRGKEWWGPERDFEEWKEKWVAENPPPS